MGEFTKIYYYYRSPIGDPSKTHWRPIGDQYSIASLVSLNFITLKKWKLIFVNKTNRNYQSYQPEPLHLPFNSPRDQNLFIFLLFLPGTRTSTSPLIPPWDRNLNIFLYSSLGPEPRYLPFIPHWNQNLDISLYSFLEPESTFSFYSSLETEPPLFTFIPFGTRTSNPPLPPSVEPEPPLLLFIPCGTREPLLLFCLPLWNQNLHSFRSYLNGTRISTPSFNSTVEREPSLLPFIPQSNLNIHSFLSFLRVSIWVKTT